MPRMFGVDISGYQEGIDIYDLTADFVIVKATEGTQGTVWNPDYRDMLDAALDAVGLAGAYHYANGGDPIAEADCFYDAIGDYAGRIVPCLDWEGKGNRKFESGEDVEWCLAFMDRISERMGSSCLLYTSKDVCNEYDWTDVAERYPLWGAEYAYDGYTWDGYPDAPWQSGRSWGAWGDDVTIHQFGYVNPKPNNGGFEELDGNVFYGTCSDWERMCGQGEGGGREMADEIEGWAETLEECRDAADYAYCTCEAYSCGYSQPNRTGISFESLRGGWSETDCSYGLATWLYWGDILPDLYGFWTAIEVDYLVGQGFELLDAGEVEPMRNDVLWRPGHTGLYVGDGMQAEALWTERHDAGYDGSIPGDQDGGETVVREYPAGGWVYILRPPCNQGVRPEPEPRPEIPDEGVGAVYRLYDAGSGAHLYTANLDEARRVSSWMDYEGVAWRVSGDGQPVYRLYDERSGDHFLTASESERDTARSWMADEGVAFVTQGDIPVHRLFDEASGQHFYTASEHEYQAVRQWMTDEGIAFYATSERGQIAYAAHVQSIGWMAPVKSGETAGTSGRSLRLEALRIVPPRGMVIDAMAHVQGIGDVWVDGIGHEGGTIGTVGESRRVEGIAIRVVSGGHLQYRCHIQRKGWTPWVDDGNYCGTRGERLRVEAVQIRFA